MKILRIKRYHYPRLGIAKYRLTVQSVIDSVKNNPNFSNPVPDIADLQSSLDHFSQLAAQVEAKNFTLKPQRDLARTIVHQKLDNLITYCQFISLRDSANFEEAKAKIESANLTVNEKKGNSSGSRLPAPGNPRVKSLSKAILLEFNDVKNARMYVVMQTKGYPEENSVWTETLTARVKLVINDCVPGEIRTFKICAIGSAGKGQPSDYVSAIAGL